MSAHESLVDFSNFLKIIEQYQNRKLACLAEISYLYDWISADEVLKKCKDMMKNQYGQYLKDLIAGKHVDALH